MYVFIHAFDQYELCTNRDPGMGDNLKEENKVSALIELIFQGQEMTINKKIFDIRDLGM